MSGPPSSNPSSQLRDTKLPFVISEEVGGSTTPLFTTGTMHFGSVEKFALEVLNFSNPTVNGFFVGKFDMLVMF